MCRRRVKELPIPLILPRKLPRGIILSPRMNPDVYKERNIMFFMTKEKSGKQDSLKKKSREPRYSCIAHVCINGFEGEALLRNMNSSGFCMESKTYAAIIVKEHYILQIMPEVSSNIDPFELEVEARWIRSTEASFSSGFFIVKHPVGRSFEKYLDFIKKRG
jgi:hypothetical protein